MVNSLQGAPSLQCSQYCAFNSVFVTKLAPDGSTLLYSTYIGAPSVATEIFGAPEPATSIAADPGGGVYVTGGTSGANFPGVKTTEGGSDAFVIRLDPKGAWIGTKLFGGSGNDVGTSIVLGPDGYIYLGGTTTSPDFPVTQNSYLTTLPGPTSAFLVKVGFNSALGTTSGTVLYSTYLGPGTSASVAADAGGNAYIAAATTSAAWPTTAGAAQPKCAANCTDIAVAKLDPAGQKLIYATYLGGSQAEAVGGIAVDTSGNAYIAGATNSPDFPVTPGVLETHRESQPYANFPLLANYTGFVAKLSPDATTFVYATYLGGSASDQAMAIAVDAAGNAYVGGTTTSPDFPLRQAIQSTPFNTICNYYYPSDTIPDYEYNCASGGFLSVLNPERDGAGLVHVSRLRIGGRRGARLGG